MDADARVAADVAVPSLSSSPRVAGLTPDAAALLLVGDCISQDPLVVVLTGFEVGSSCGWSDTRCRRPAAGG